MYANKKWYASRKLWVALGAAIVPVLNGQFGWGLDPEAFVVGALAVVSYITGQAFVDVQTVKQEGQAFTRIKAAEAEVFVRQNTGVPGTTAPASEVGFVPEIVE